MTSHTEPTVAITGGARGIGRATAERLAAAGARVAIGDIDAGTARAAAQAIDGQIAAFELDVTDQASFDGFIDAAEQELGPLSVLVNNAGIMPVGPFAEETAATTRRMVDINCFGVVHGTKAILPRFLDREAGHIVNVASIAGRVAYPHGVTYCATKHFVVGHSEAQRLELRGTGVRVSCVQPVLVNTELAAGVRGAVGVSKVEADDVAKAITRAIDSPRFDVLVPGRMGLMLYGLNLLPRSARDLAMRALRADKVLVRADDTAREDYEARASG